MWRDGTAYVGNAADDEATRAARQRDKDVRLLGAALA